MENRVQEFRKRRGLTQTQLAKEVGSTKRTIYAIETEEHDLRISLAKKLASFFGSSVDELFCEDRRIASEEKRQWVVDITQRIAHKLNMSCSDAIVYLENNDVYKQIFDAYEEWFSGSRAQLANLIVRDTQKKRLR